MLLNEELVQIASDIKFQEGWSVLIRLGDKKEDPIYLQVLGNTRDNFTDNEVSWTGRKWLLSRHMTPGEVVQTAWMAIQTAILHEAREQFRYRGVTIFDPHYDIDRLVELRCDPTSIKAREPKQDRKPERVSVPLIYQE